MSGGAPSHLIRAPVIRAALREDAGLVCWRSSAMRLSTRLEHELRGDRGSRVPIRCSVERPAAEALNPDSLRAVGLRAVLSQPSFQLSRPRGSGSRTCFVRPAHRGSRPHVAARIGGRACAASAPATSGVGWRSTVTRLRSVFYLRIERRRWTSGSDSAGVAMS